MGAAVDRLTGRYLDLTRAASPITATWLGFHDADGELDDLTEGNLDAYASGVAALQAEAAALDPADAEEAADRDGLVATLAESLFVHEVERPWRRNPFEAATAIPSAVLLLIARDFAPKTERLANVATRLEAAPRLLQQAQSLLGEPCPALWRQMAVQAARGGAGFLGATLPRLAAGTELAGRVGAASEQACDALEDFASWLEDEHAEQVGDDATFAIGPEAQARRLREVHCFESTPEQLTAIGEAEVARISDALAEQAGRLGGDDWPVTLERVKQRHPSLDELVGVYRRELASLERFVFEHDLATNPEAEAVVEATPEFLRGLMGFAAYLGAGPFDAFQQGYFWVTPPADDAGLSDHSYASIPAIAAHEGYPGHHLQVTSVNRLVSVTRRTLRSPVMIEGWGSTPKSWCTTPGTTATRRGSPSSPCGSCERSGSSSTWDCRPAS